MVTSTKTRHLDLIQMLPISQTYSELTSKPYQIFGETLLYGQKGKHYVEIYHHLLKNLKIVFA